MKYCTIIHNTIVSKLRPLFSSVPSTPSRVNVSEDIEYSFKRLDRRSGVAEGMIEAICDVSRYTGSAHEYMCTRKLVDKHVVANR